MSEVHHWAGNSAGSLHSKQEGLGLSLDCTMIFSFPLTFGGTRPRVVGIIKNMS